jgi:hypothetical protein
MNRCLEITTVIEKMRRLLLLLVALSTLSFVLIPSLLQKVSKVFNPHDTIQKLSLQPALRVVESADSRINRLIEDERGLLENELKDYEFSEGENLASLRAAPVQALVATTWRSGSTFLGDILNSHPATYYHYEPLLHYDIRQARSGVLAADAVKTLKDLMHCNYDRLGWYLNYGRNHHWLFKHNKRLWKHCIADTWRSRKRVRNSFCWGTDFLNKFCPLFPFQSMKTVRLRLNLTQEFVQDPSLNVRVLLLIRDPRGTMQSRKHRIWCPGNPDCDDPKMLCQDLVDDYHAFQVLVKEFPDRYMTYRYEDFSMDPANNTKEVFKFFGLSMHHKVVQFLDSHTKSNKGGVSSTFRDSKTAPFKWREQLTMSEVVKIQDSCKEAMHLWGYARVENESELRTFSPVIWLKD